jgi:Bifunctional DNA primase/polymerase, N-terminal/Primase C terminal 2 (PriCT-2)
MLANDRLESMTGRPRTADEMAEARAMLVPFYRVGYRFILLSGTSKVPIEVGWQTIDYTTKVRPWLARGGNIGVLLSETDLILDVDPRHGGLESLGRLQADLGIDLSAAPAVLSGRGDGGRHIYLKKPTSLRVRKDIGGYAGIDVKMAGGFVLAPGSRHPETGGLYRPDPAAPGIDQVSDAPAALLDALRRPTLKPRAHAGGGELPPEDLEMLLGVLDPADYGAGQYERWFRLAAAAHDATNGEGLDVWLGWAARDLEYGSADDDDRNTAMWNSLIAGKAGGISYLHLLGEVARAGRVDVVLKVEPDFVFEPHRAAGALIVRSDLTSAPIRDTSEQRRTARVIRTIPTAKES